MRYIKICLCIVAAQLAGYANDEQSPALLNRHATFLHQQCDSIEHPLWKGHFLYRFRGNHAGKNPTVFFLHGVNAADPGEYGGLIDHIVGRGWNVVFLPYSTIIAMTSPMETYDAIGLSLTAAIRAWKTTIDTTRIGIVGHSYGGGAAPWMAHQLLVRQAWGANGSFLYIMAPWFSWNITNAQLQSFPNATLLLTQIFANDNINDFRMAQDIYYHFGTNTSNKRFVCVRASAPLRAGHDTPNGHGDGIKGTDALDSLAIYPLFDRIALCACRKMDLSEDSLLSAVPRSFSHREVTLEISTAPAFSAPQGRFVNFWNHVMNPRVGNEDGAARFGTVATISNFFDVAQRKLFSNADTMAETDGDVSIRRIWDSEIGDRKVTVVVMESGDPKPILFFVPAFVGTSFAEYRPFLVSMARKGYACVFINHSLFVSNGAKERPNLVSRELASVCENLLPMLDTTRILLVGHGFGATVLPQLATHFVLSRQWGKLRADVWAISPGNCCGAKMENNAFPHNVRLFIWNFQDSWKHDWRFGKSLFDGIALAAEQKYWVNSEYVDKKCHPTSFSPRTAAQGVLESTFFSSTFSTACVGESTLCTSDTCCVFVPKGPVVRSVFGHRTQQLDRSGKEYFFSAGK